MRARADAEVGEDLERRRRAVERVEVQARRAAVEQRRRTARWPARRRPGGPPPGRRATASSRSTTAAGTGVPDSWAKRSICLMFVTGMIPGRTGIVAAEGATRSTQPEVGGRVEEELGDREVGPGIGLRRPGSGRRARGRGSPGGRRGRRRRRPRSRSTSRTQPDEVDRRGRGPSGCAVHGCPGRRAGRRAAPARCGRRRRRSRRRRGAARRARPRRRSGGRPGSSVVSCGDLPR